jgi:DNA polymerase III delta prime subunit
LDYDIAKAFDEVNRNRLKNTFNKYIVDKRFWITINRILSTGVAEDFTTLFEHKGVAQGSIISPFLFNIYMHELDKFIVGLQTQAALTYKEYVSGTYGNPEAETNYRKIAQEFRMENWKKLIQKYGSSEKVLEARKVAYKEHHDKYGRHKGVDLEIRHIQYVRYGDEFLIGVVGSRNFATKLQKDINLFIKGNLHLRVKKAEIIYRNGGSVKFLGHHIKLQEFRKKYNTLPKAIRAAKLHKKKTLARFAEVDKRLARSKTNQYRSNIIKEIKKICSVFRVSAKNSNTQKISELIALREVIQQLSDSNKFTEPGKFISLLMSTRDTECTNDNPALDR